MKDLATVPYYNPAERLTEILCKKTQNDDPLFFRVLVAYYFTKVASMMRCSILTHDRGSIPVSMYALNLAPSGHGKGHSTNIIEEQVINRFREIFLETTFQVKSEENLAALAVKRALRKGTDEDKELIATQKEFDRLGTLAFSFDSGTTAAVKQMRHKLLMAGAGSMNMEIDEIGSNLLGNMEVLTTFLELFDVGKIKQKLTKNTNENIRSEEIDGRTPTNMMLFGTPAKLLNGSKEEEEFSSMLETGYARRCIFGYSALAHKVTNLTPAQIYDIMTDKKSSGYIRALSTKLGKLAEIQNFGIELEMTKDVSILLIEYKLNCETAAAALAEHEEVKKAELAHRYFKALKLAGTYAFIDGSALITEDHLYSAFKLVEDSGEAFQKILTRDKNYVKLANYIANVKREITHVDLMQDLPFYKGSEQARREIMNSAVAYGYKNNIIIKRYTQDNIEFMKGESLEEANTNEIIVSYSQDYTTGYLFNKAPFDQLHKLTQQSGYHFVNHELLEGYRDDAHCKPGFNMVVIDVDDGIDLDTVKMLLTDYTYLLYTTKRHTPEKPRFRLIFPLNYVVKLNNEDFKEFMRGVFDWLPFEVDRQTAQRSRKWLTYAGQHYYNKGEPLDALLFIPKTSKADKRKQIINSQQALNGLERWFINNTGDGNRSNQLIRYALALVDMGLDIDSTRNNVLALNRKLEDPLDDAEVLSTIVLTATKHIHKRDTGA